MLLALPKKEKSPFSFQVVTVLLKVEKMLKLLHFLQNVHLFSSTFTTTSTFSYSFLLFDVDKDDSNK